MTSEGRVLTPRCAAEGIFRLDAPWGSAQVTEAFREATRVTFVCDLAPDHAGAHKAHDGGGRLLAWWEPSAPPNTASQPPKEGS